MSIDSLSVRQINSLRKMHRVINSRKPEKKISSEKSKVKTLCNPYYKKSIREAISEWLSQSGKVNEKQVEMFASSFEYKNVRKDFYNAIRRDHND